MADLPQRVRAESDAGRVLVHLEDADERAQAVRWLEEAGYGVVTAASDAAAIQQLERRLDLDVLLTDATVSAELVDAVRQSPAGLEVVLAGPSDVVVAAQAVSRGAFSYLSHPLTEPDLLQHVARALHAARATQLAEDHRLSLPEDVHFEGIVGTTPRMREVMEILRKAAPTDAPIVITGETGTGKELLASAIHRSSGRRGGPFVALHLLATPAGLVESELFGHKRGAFTGALADRVGKMELVDGGTLFLDELGDIPLETQTKLLRVLETKSFEPVGSNRAVKSDFRLITATNQDIEAMIAEKKFREELWFRLNVIRVELPPLRERRADIPLLVDRFVAEFARAYNKEIDGVDADVIAYLQRLPWPGNIRDLRNAVNAMVVLTDGPRITARDIPPQLRGVTPAEVPGGPALAGRSMDDIERDAIKATLELTQGNRKAAAELLQIGERTLYRKIEKYGLS